MADIINTQRSFAIKAMHKPAHRFDHLYRIICRQDWIETAMRGVLANKGARTPGLDGMTKEDLSSEEAQRTLRQEIEQELRERSFCPSPVRRVHIPKSPGKYRPLGLSMGYQALVDSFRGDLPPSNMLMLGISYWMG